MLSQFVLTGPRNKYPVIIRTYMHCDDDAYINIAIVTRDATPSSKSLIYTSAHVSKETLQLILIDFAVESGSCIQGGPDWLVLLSGWRKSRWHRLFSNVLCLHLPWQCQASVTFPVQHHCAHDACLRGHRCAYS